MGSYPGVRPIKEQRCHRYTRFPTCCGSHIFGGAIVAATATMSRSTQRSFLLVPPKRSRRQRVNISPRRHNAGRYCSVNASTSAFASEGAWIVMTILRKQRNHTRPALFLAATRIWRTERWGIVPSSCGCPSCHSRSETFFLSHYPKRKKGRRVNPSLLRPQELRHQRLHRQSGSKPIHPKRQDTDPSGSAASASCGCANCTDETDPSKSLRVKKFNFFDKVQASCTNTDRRHQKMNFTLN